MLQPADTGLHVLSPRLPGAEGAAAEAAAGCSAGSRRSRASAEPCRGREAGNRLWGPDDRRKGVEDRRDIGDRCCPLGLSTLAPRHLQSTPCLVLHDLSGLLENVTLL